MPSVKEFLIENSDEIPVEQKFDSKYEKLIKEMSDM